MFSLFMRPQSSFKNTGFESTKERSTALLNKVLAETYISAGKGIPSLAKLQAEVSAKLERLEVGKVVIFRSTLNPCDHRTQYFRVDAMIGDDEIRSVVKVNR